jgi:hypothetical protein
MNLEVIWHVAAERDLLDLHWRRGEIIDRAIRRFADEGVGNLRRVEASSGREYILRVSGYEVRFTVDHIGQTMTVWAIWRARKRLSKPTRTGRTTRRR